MVGGSCAYAPVPAVQTLLANLGALDVCMTVTQLDVSLSEECSVEVMENTKEILTLCNVFLMWLVCRPRLNDLRFSLGFESG